MMHLTRGTGVGVAVIIGVLSLCRKVNANEALPEILPLVNSWVFDGGVIEMTCVGEARVKWQGPETELDIQANVSEVVSNGGHASTLTLHAVTVGNAGRYWCTYADRVRLFSYTDVYVNLSRRTTCPMRSARRKGHVARLVRSRTYTIPCGRELTFILADVQLWKVGFGRVALEKLVWYKKGEGFVIEWPNQFFDGIFFCLSQYDLASGQSCRLVGPKVRLIFDGSDSRPSSPVISWSANEVLVGQTLALSCYVNVPADQCAHISWVVASNSNHQQGLNGVRPSCDLDEDNFFRYSVSSNTLAVRRIPNVKVVKYGCRVHYGGDVVKTRFVSFSVHNTSFVNLTASKNFAVVQHGDRRAILSVSVDAFPVPKVIWYKGLQRVTSLTMPRITQVQTRHRLLLDIDRPERNDSGLYRVVATSSNTTAEFKVWLMFTHLDEPVVTSEPNGDDGLFWTDSRDPFIFHCNVEAYPKPDITWLWRSFCYDQNDTSEKYSYNETSSADHRRRFIGCENDTDGEIIETSVDSVGDNIVRVNDSSVAIISAKTSGWFVCRANNTSGETTSQSARLIISDQRSRFAMTVKKRDVHARAILVECRANALLYRSVRIRDYPGRVCGERVEQVLTRTNYSHVATLNFVACQEGVLARLRCDAINASGLTDTVYIEIPKVAATTRRMGKRRFKMAEPTFFRLHLVDVVVITCPILAGFMSTLLVFLCTRRYRKRLALKECRKLLLESNSGNLSEFKHRQLPSDMAYRENYEMPRGRLRVGKLLAKGNFSPVYLGLVISKSDSHKAHHVAVKKITGCRDEETMRRYVHELKALSNVGHHPNIVNLVGANTAHLVKGELYIILDFCEYGTLKEHLVKGRYIYISTINNYVTNDETHRYVKDTSGYINEGVDVSISPYSSRQLFSYVRQVCSAMEYLSQQHMNQVIIAADKVLMTRNGVVKLSGVGVNGRSNTALKNPWAKWAALENLTEDTPTTSTSLVWSFGVFAWEVFSLGSDPYPGVKVDDNFVARINRGYRMAIPAQCGDSMYLLMKACWRHCPQDRPTFEKLERQIDEMLHDKSGENTLDLNDLSSMDRTADGTVPTLVNEYLPMGTATSRVCATSANHAQHSVMPRVCENSATKGQQSLEHQYVNGIV